MYTLIVLFFLLSIIASFLCSVLEAVLLSTSPAFAESQLEENPAVGLALVDFHKNIDQPLSAILTLNAIAHTVGAIGVGAGGMQWQLPPAYFQLSQVYSGNRCPEVTKTTSGNIYTSG